MLFERRHGVLCAGCVLVLWSFLASSVQAEGHYAEINGTRIYYEVEGEGHPLVLIHGYSLDTRMWDDQMPAFTEQYQVIRYDRRGFGKSGTAQTGSTDAEDLYALLRHLGIKSCTVLGMSQGGKAALDLTLDHPEMVDALILQDTGVEGFRWPRDPHWKRKSLMEIAQTEGLEKMKEAWLDYPFFEISRKKPEVFKKLKRMVMDWPGPTMPNPHEKPKPTEAPKKQAIDRLGEIQAPTLVILGEFERAGMQCAAEALTYGIPNAEKAVISGAGHMVNMDEPKAFNAVLLGFLENVDRKRFEQR